MGWYPGALRQTPPLRGPRVAFVRLFEPGVSSCLSLEEEEGSEGRLVGLSGGGGATSPQPETHSRRHPVESNSAPSESHRGERCLRESLAARTPCANISEEKCPQGGQRGPGRIGLGADPSNHKLAEGSTSSCALSDQGLGGGGSQEVTGVVKFQEVVGVVLVPSNAPRHPTLSNSGPSSWPRQVAATRNPWSASPFGSSSGAGGWLAQPTPNRHG